MELDMLAKLDVWLGEFEKACKKVPPQFDAQYFCTGLERLIELDHHQLTARILSLLFQFCPIFDGSIREIVLSDFILTKYFFHLFLHWDDVVRNYFHQLLAYKFVRIPRSQLSKASTRPASVQVDHNTFAHERFAIDMYAAAAATKDSLPYVDTYIVFPPPPSVKSTQKSWRTFALSKIKLEATLQLLFLSPNHLRFVSILNDTSINVLKNPPSQPMVFDEYLLT